MTDMADAMLARWRTQGADRVDPIAFQRIAALQRRAAAHHGDIRRTLDARLATLVQAYADHVEQAASAASPARDHGAAGVRTDDTLRGLLDGFNARAQARNAGRADNTMGNLGAPNATPVGGASPAYPELPALEDFRKLWSRVRSDSQVERSLARSPTNAGPLNSSRLVHRSLTLMHALSPDYLQQFLSYVDAMSWLEQLNDSGVLTAKDVPQTDSGLPRPRSKPRKRRK
ncbi:DUF2894 domain-containing protein [Luteimonas sp. RIT-PG2_3]